MVFARDCILSEKKTREYFTCTEPVSAGETVRRCRKHMKLYQERVKILLQPDYMR